MKQCPWSAERGAMTKKLAEKESKDQRGLTPVAERITKETASPNAGDNNKSTRKTMTNR